MITGRLISIHIGELDTEVFKKHPIWCEYYEPFEIDELIALGEDSEFLNNEIIKQNEISGGQLHPYYSLPNGSKLKREFLFVKGDFRVFEKIFSGYVVLVRNQISTICIFYQGDVVDLYLNEDFSDDNFETLLTLTGNKCFNGCNMIFELECNKNVHPDKGQIKIPCCG